MTGLTITLAVFQLWLTHRIYRNRKDQPWPLTPHHS